jgi:uncharacterized protein (DUF1810 family)
MHDPFSLLRFVEAQRPVFTRVMEELRAGHKTSHWMWFIFPQLHGLGHSEIAERFAISGAAEARAYLLHDVLGPRLEESVSTLLQHSDKSALEILGHPDDLKLRSCLTLFASIKPEHPLFQQALNQFFAGEPDARTLLLLRE